MNQEFKTHRLLVGKIDDELITALDKFTGKLMLVFCPDIEADTKTALRVARHIASKPNVTGVIVRNCEGPLAIAFAGCRRRIAMSGAYFNLRSRQLDDAALDFLAQRTGATVEDLRAKLDYELNDVAALTIGLANCIEISKQPQSPH